MTPPATAPVDNDDVDLTVLMKADEYFKCSTLTSKSSPTNVDTSDVIQQQHVNNERSRSKVNGNVLYGELVVYGYVQGYVISRLPEISSSVIVL